MTRPGSVLVCLVGLGLAGMGGLASGCTAGEGLTRELGGPCTTDLDCAGRCLPRPIWPGGFCTRACQGDEGCPVASSCAPGPGVCLFACFDDRDCAFLGAGWGCRSAGDRLVCAPAAALADAGVLADAP